MRAPVLVVGSYPPVPGPAAAATLDAVRRAYAAGEDVVVVAPRHGAAHRTMRVAGPHAGSLLDRLRRESEASHLVLCAEAGLPIPLVGKLVADRGRQAQTVAGVAEAMARFDVVSLVVTGDLEVAPEVLAPLWPHVDEIIAGGVAGPDVVARALGAPAGMIRPAAPAPGAAVAGSGSGSAEREGVEGPGRVGEPAAVSVHRRADAARAAAGSKAGAGAQGVTLFGPTEVLVRERPRQAVSIAARAVLGPLAPTVRRWLVAAVRHAR